MEPILRFRVRNQSIGLIDDKFRVVAGSRNYLRAEFEFLTDDWNGVVKTAIFEYGGWAKHVLLDGDSCLIPWEALARPGIMKVSVFGGDLITVGQALVTVHESGYRDGTAPGEPTPDIYAQILSAASDAKKIAESVREDADNGVFDGADGKSAYEYAQDGGYGGTEEEFARDLAAILAGVGDGERLPRYTGDAEALPSFEGQTLPTKGTSVYDDITVLPIRVTEVSNLHGGKTISI